MPLKKSNKQREISYLKARNILFTCVTDQAWGQDGWILAEFFFCIFMDRDKVEVYKKAK